MCDTRSLDRCRRTMGIAATLGLVVLSALAAPAFGQSFVGEWTATATTPGGEVSETVKVVKTSDGYAITAKLVGVPEGTPEAAGVRITGTQ
jgi:hypothetical protein